MQVELISPDRHGFSCYRAEPSGRPIGAVLVIQEIFGVNEHIRSVCDRYAAEGYLALAPALFDRIQPGIELGYGAEDRAQAMELAFKRLDIEQALLDIQTTIDSLGDSTRVGVVGFCFGGLLAWLSACELDHVGAVSCYYPGGIIRYKDCQPHCPVQLHFGAKDTLIPVADAETIARQHPQAEVYLYEASHGFNCDKRESYDAVAAKLAFARTLRFLGNYLQERNSSRTPA